jgi:hypothetical protein
VYIKPTTRGVCRLRLPITTTEHHFPAGKPVLLFAVINRYLAEYYQLLQ